MHLKVTLRIPELESTDNLSSPYSIILSNTAFERFGKPYGCNIEFALSRRSLLDVSYEWQLDCAIIPVLVRQQEKS